MLKGIKELVDLLLLWGFMYVGSFLLLIVGVVWIIKTNPTPPTPIIHEHKIVQNIIQPTKRVLFEREVCKTLEDVNYSMVVIVQIVLLKVFGNEFRKVFLLYFI